MYGAGLEIIGSEFDGGMAVGGFFGDVVKAVRHGVKSATRAVSKGVGKIAHEAGKIPVIGKPLHVALSLTPFKMIDDLAHGARIDHAVLSDMQRQLAGARALAPYAATVVSMVPGVGTGVAGAIGAASALAQGRPITEAAMAAVRASIPGGSLAQGGFDAARKIASGKPVTGAVLAAARAQLPAEARRAFDIGLAMTQGKRLQAVLVKSVQDLAPAEVASFVKLGGKLAIVEPRLLELRRKLTGKEKIGFDLAKGVLAHAGTPEHAILAFRKKLGKEAQRGFDAAIAVNARESELEASSRRRADRPERAASSRHRAPGLRVAPMPGRGSWATDGAKALEAASRVMAEVEAAKLAEWYGHALTPAQIATLAKVRDVTARAKAGDPRAQRIAKLLSVAAKYRKDLNISAGWSPRIVSPGEPTGDIFIGSGWSPRIVSPGEPTGDIFIGAAERARKQRVSVYV